MSNLFFVKIFKNFTETTSPDTNLTLTNFSSWFLSAFFMNSARIPMSEKKINRMNGTRFLLRVKITAEKYNIA